jgi:hypothetical protein
MLARLSKFENQVSLIEGTGIQFLDFGFCNDPKKLAEGNFLQGQITKLDGSTAQLPILLSQDSTGNLYRSKSEKYTGPVNLFSTGSESLKAFNSKWLPIPFFQMNSDGSFMNGPLNWVRVRIKQLDTPDDDGNFYRLTFAFDTNIPKKAGATYLTPTNEDIVSGKVFGLDAEDDHLNSFIGLSWVDKWINQCWAEGLVNNKNIRLSKDQIREKIEEWPTEALAKYLHVLNIISEGVRLPKIKLLANSQHSGKPFVEANLILDIGNSRTCAVVLEKHPDQRGNLANSYTLELRDLGETHLVYSDPFESRVEFSQVEFGYNSYSLESGRNEAFIWPTFTRVGSEATRLASKRRGTEGATGLASPKRYLWDESSFPLDWRFNQPDSHSLEPLANEGIFVGLINESGDALCDLDNDDPNRFPVINPRYSRSSLMTFAIAEILSQTLGLINSPGQRLRMPNYDLARSLTKIVLTLPPAMPLQEQAILRKRASQACKLVWQSLGYLDEDGNPVDSDSPLLPDVIIRFDEATCGQVVWLYSMINSQFGGSAPSMFKSLKRHFGDANIREGNILRVASIDIGGGTTDLVIADYSLEGKGNNVTIIPNQVCREGFTIAGDDILKRIIQSHVITAIEDELKICGLSDPTSLTQELFGGDRANEDIQFKTLRRQFTTQVLSPAGLALLHAYENIEKVVSLEPEKSVLTELLPSQPSHNVFVFINDAANSAGANGFNLANVQLTIDLKALHNTVLSGTEINRALEALCELVYVYNVDVLLLTGRPSRLKGIASTVKSLMAVPPDRVIQMHGFRSGNWYPFHRLGCIDDPKTTAAVGAMLCTIAEGGIPNFLFRSDKLNLKSTTKFIGKLSRDGQIPDTDIYYSDVSLDDPEYVLPEKSFEFRGAMWLGFRQLPIERWRSSLIYILDYADDESRRRLHPKTPLQVTLKRDLGGIKKGDTERFEIAEVVTMDGTTVNRRGLKLQLQTLPDDAGYWLDSGHVKEA